MNRALRLVGPTLVCPLAFCFYNIISILSGLIYFDQWALLSALQIGLVSLGTIVLLAGVWIVSIKVPDPTKDCSIGGIGKMSDERLALLAEEVNSEGESDEDDEEGDQRSTFSDPLHAMCWLTPTHLCPRS